MASSSSFADLENRIDRLAMTEEPKRRSRFGDEPSEAPRRSKFDRRSRSPTDREPESSRRSRSPATTPKPADNAAASDAAAKARAAAAKINAMLAKQPMKPAVAAPVRLTAPSTTSNGNEIGENGLNKDIYQQDGDFIKDIEINDLKNRYVMTKGPTQKMIKEETGADVTTRGSYYPDKRMATPTQPPLYLHITSITKEGLEKAVAKIEELIAQDLPDLVDQRRFRRGREDVELDSRGRRKWPEAKIPVDLEPIPGFNLRASVVGAGGANVKHIQQESGCRIQIKGRGSGYMESETGVESDEDMYLHVTSPEQAQVEVAKELCESLLVSVRERYEEFKEGRQRGGGGGGYGGGYNDRRGNDGYQGGRDRQASGDQAGYDNAAFDLNAYTAASYGATAVPMDNASAQQMDGEQYAAWAQYYAQNPDQDPYAQYGGFTAYMAMYSQWQQSANTGYGAPVPGDNTGAVPPPPPS